MKSLTLDELQYLYNKFRITCPTDGIMAKLIETKLADEIARRQFEEAESARLNKVFGITADDIPEKDSEYPSAAPNSQYE